MNFSRTSFSAVFFLAVAFSCSSGNNVSDQENLGQNDNSNSAVISNQEKTDDWEVLFDGENLDHWRSAKSDSFPSQGWVIEDGALVLNGKGGDIITREKYGDFELTWEFNLTREANSGIKYFVDSLTHQETGQVSFNGPEFQIIDDSNHEAIKDDPNGLSSTAALYLLYAPENKTLKPAGEWNEARIVAKDGQVEHWHNGTKVLSYQRGSTDFLDRMAETKFKEYPDYGQAEEGHILITDHQDRVFFRNIRIRRL
jgi:hypothetical protein